MASKVISALLSAVRRGSIAPTAIGSTVVDHLLKGTNPLEDKKNQDLVDSVLQGIKSVPAVQSINDFFPRSESVRSNALKNIIKGNAPFNADTLKDITGQRTTQFGDIFRDQGLQDKGFNFSDLANFASPTNLGGNISANNPAATLGVGVDVATDPFSFLGAESLKPAEQALPTIFRTAQEQAIAKQFPNQAEHIAKAYARGLPIDSRFGDFLAKFPNAKPAEVDDFITNALKRNLDKQNIIDRTLAEGGSTTHLTGEAPTTGNIVSPYKGREVTLMPDKFTPQAIDAYIEANKDLLKNPDHALGTWKNKDGNIVLDVTVNKPTLDEAVKLGRQAKQDAVFNLDTGTEIPVTSEGSKVTGIQKEILDVIKGKSKLSDFDPETKAVIRQNAGEKNWQIFDAHERAQSLGKILNDDPKIFEAANNALKGDAQSFGALPKLAQDTVIEMRNHIDTLSQGLKSELDTAISQMTPQQLASYQERFGLVEGGKKLPPQVLSDTIANNLGSYVRRQYALFQNVGYKPTDEVVNNAVKGLSRDLEITPQEARNKVNAILKNKEVDLLHKKLQLKVRPDSFIARKEVPEYMRELLGEIKDPRYNYIQTVRNLTEASENFKMFRNLDEAGLFSDEPTAALTKKVPSGGTLAWGTIDGKYTSEEVYNLLHHIQQSNNVADSGFLKLLSGLKATKTIFSPKAHGHNALGNLTFAVLDDSFPLGKNLQYYKEFLKELPKGSKSPIIKELIQQNVIGNEFGSLGTNEIKWLEDLIKDPYSLKDKNPFQKAGESIAKASVNTYQLEDQLFKAASYLKKTRGLGLTPSEAADKVFRSFPNYAEASKLAQTVRTSAAGQVLANPFFTFRSEAHRIFVEAAKDPAKRIKLAAVLGSRAAINTALLAVAGKGMKDIVETFLTRPELATETLLNPANPNLDLNTRYIDPFNTRGAFAPLLKIAGASGINPFDYLLDFSQFSPDFGYSNITANALEPLLTAKGKFGENLEPQQQLKAGLEGLFSGSLTKDLPRAINPQEPDERTRSLFRIFGVDLEKRNPDYLKPDLSKRLSDKIKKGEDITTLKSVIDYLGFDSNQMEANALKRINKVKKPDQTKETLKRQEEVSKLFGF